MTAALFGARSFSIFRRGLDEGVMRRKESRAFPSAATHRPSVVSRSGFTSSSSRVGLSTELSGEQERRFSARFSRRIATSSSTSGAFACPLFLSKKIFNAGCFSITASRSCFTDPGRRIAVEAPEASAPYHSVRTPPRPKTRTGPNAGSCLKERSASAAGVPDAGFSRSRTRTPARDASGPRRPTSSQIFFAAVATDTGSFLEKEKPPTSDLWRISGETILRTTSSPGAAARSS